MKELLEYLINTITGSQDFSVEEATEGDHVTYKVDASDDIAGIIIGKQGKTIKNLRRVLAIKAAKNNQTVHISVNEANSH